MNCFSPTVQAAYPKRQPGHARPYRGPHDLRRYGLNTRYQRCAIAGHAKAAYLPAMGRLWSQTEFARGVIITAIVSTYAQVVGQWLQP